MKYVISLGGSLIVTDEVNTGFLKELKEVLLKSKHEFIIICGGGSTARKYIKAGSEFSASGMQLDMIGIKATELNAQLVATIMECKIAKHARDFINNKDKILVGCGYFPGITTDADSIVAAGLARAGAVINMSNVAGVYDKDPKKNTDAKMYARMTYNELIKLASEYTLGLGANFVFDLQACKLAKRDKIKVVMLMGIDNLKKFIEGKKFNGTVIE